MTKRNDNGLNVQQLTFCKYYVADPERNAARAYKQAHPKCKPASAWAAASRLLSDVNVKAEIERLSAELLGPILERYQVTEENILRELSLMGFSRLDDVMDWGPDGMKVKDSELLHEFQRAGVAEVSQTIT